MWMDGQSMCFEFLLFSSLFTLYNDKEDDEDQEENYTAVNRLLIHTWRINKNNNNKIASNFKFDSHLPKYNIAILF